MRKLILILGLTSVILFCEAQQLPNSGFENWTNKVYYSNPKSFASTNAQLYMSGALPNVTKVSDAISGSYAALLTNVAIDSDTIFGGIFLGNPGEGGLTGGYPFDERPDSFGFFYKSQMTTIDTGMAVIFFKKAGNVIGIAGLSLTGSKSSYTRICNEITFFDSSIPDTIALIIFSGNPDGKLVPGSYIQLDSLFLVGATKKLPNPSFETWENVQAEDPDGWVTSNSFSGPGSLPGVVKSTDKRSGNYSIKITTSNTGFGQNIGFITNGKVSGENGPQGGTRVNANPDKISFWYKNTPMGTDTAIALVVTTRWDATADSAEKLEKQVVKLTPATTWTYKEVLLSYNITSKKADTIMVGFSPSNLEDSMASTTVGSLLMLDDLNMTFYSGAVKNVRSNYMQAWPVPASSYLNINLSGITDDKATLRIYSAGGSLINQTTIDLDGGKGLLDISKILNGNYLIVAESMNNRWTIPFVVLH